MPPVHHYNSAIHTVVITIEVLLTLLITILGDTMADFDLAATKLKITEAMKAVTTHRKPRMTIHEFLQRLNRYIAQIEIDRTKLQISSYTDELEFYFITLVAMLVQVHADRTAAEGKGARQMFGKAMKKIKMYHKILIMVTEHVIENTNDDTVKTALKKIKNEDNNIDTLYDVLALSAVLKDYLEITVTFTPSGITVNEGYLQIVTAEAEALLKLDGKPKTENSERSILVEEQKCLITLCMNDIDKIQKHAFGAFFMNMPYYKEHYLLYDQNKNQANSTADDIDLPEDTEIDITDSTETDDPETRE